MFKRLKRKRINQRGINGNIKTNKRLRLKLGGFYGKSPQTNEFKNGITTFTNFMNQ